MDWSWKQMRVKPSGVFVSVRDVDSTLGGTSQMRPESSVTAMTARSAIASRRKPEATPQDMCTVTCELPAEQRLKGWICLASN